MSRTSIRNKSGDLTAHALGKGYIEQRSWLTVGMTTHVVTLSRADEGYHVQHSWSGPTHAPSVQPRDWFFPNLEDARTQFKKEAKR